MIVADIAKCVREGRRIQRSFSKSINLTTVAGTYHDLSMSPGNPAAQYYVGSIATATALSRSTDGGIDHGPSVGSGYKKFIKQVVLQTVTAGAAPITIEMLDYLAFYPFISMDGGVQNLTTSISIPRYNATEDIQLMIVEQNPYTGSASLQINYTNQDGIAGRLTPVIALNTVQNIGTIATSAPTLLGQSRFVPLARGDRGVSSVESVEFLTGDVGVVCLVLVKPITPPLPIYETTSPCVWDFPFHFGFMPEVRDDAYLNFIVNPAGNATGATIYGDLETIWKDV